MTSPIGPDSIHSGSRITTLQPYNLGSATTVKIQKSYRDLNKNKAQTKLLTGFMNGKHVRILIQPLYKTIRNTPTECFQYLREISSKVCLPNSRGKRLFPVLKDPFPSIYKGEMLLIFYIFIISNLI